MCAAQNASLGSAAPGASSGKLYGVEPVVEPLVGAELEPDWPGVGDDARVGAFAAAVGEPMGEAVAGDVGARVVAAPVLGDVEPPVLAPA
jgi:hypothetical protein